MALTVATVSTLLLLYRGANTGTNELLRRIVERVKASRFRAHCPGRSAYRAPVSFVLGFRETGGGSQMFTFFESRSYRGVKRDDRLIYCLT